jgi:hypothetical protein
VRLRPHRVAVHTRRRGADPLGNIEAAGREEIRAMASGEALADNFVQTTHPPTPRSGTTSMGEAMNFAPAIGESNE